MLKTFLGEVQNQVTVKDTPLRPTFFRWLSVLSWRWKQTEHTMGMRTMMMVTTPMMAARAGSGLHWYLAPILAPAPSGGSV
mgnify:CR=1 FL=1